MVSTLITNFLKAMTSHIQYIFKLATWRILTLAVVIINASVVANDYEQLSLITLTGSSHSSLFLVTNWFILLQFVNNCDVLNYVKPFSMLFLPYYNIDFKLSLLFALWLLSETGVLKFTDILIRLVNRRKKSAVYSHDTTIARPNEIKRSRTILIKTIA